MAQIEERLYRLSDVILRLQMLDPDTPVAAGHDDEYWMMMVNLTSGTRPLVSEVKNAAANLGEAVKKRRRAPS